MARLILIVDDEPDVRTLLSTILKGEGFDIIDASNGKDAIDVLKTRVDIELVLLDIMMPRMDGLHTAHEIRKFSEVPIIVVSVKDDDTTVNMAKKLYKVAAYVKKPFDNKVLLKTIKGVLNK